MRQNASLYLHDSPGESRPIPTVRTAPPTGRAPLQRQSGPRRRMLAAFLAAASAGTLATLSVAAASTPQGGTPGAARQSPTTLSASTSAARGRPGGQSAMATDLRSGIGALLRTSTARSRAAPPPPSWRSAALHLSLARLEAAPGYHSPGRHLRHLLHARLHTSAVSYGVPTATWLALRQCESGNNYGANTGNGYFGAYQFALSTWWSIGYPGLPSEASPAMQDAAARRLLAIQGWVAWPQCSVRLGLD